VLFSATRDVSWIAELCGPEFVAESLALRAFQVRVSVLSSERETVSTRMKKIVLLSLIALFSALSVHAANPAVTREELVKRVESCEAILREFMANPETAIPANILQQARALVIVNQFKAGFFLGIKDGYATILVKQANGRWSLPVLLAAGEASLGLQVGAKAVETIIVMMNDETPRMLFNQRFNVGVDAKAVAGPKKAEVEKANHPIVAPLLVYTKSRGLFAGATVKTGYIARNDESNFTLYRTQYTLPELLYSDWVKPPSEVVPLMEYVQQIAP
jgi:lipid-binding SYLF domain-containing protein